MTDDQELGDEQLARLRRHINQWGNAIEPHMPPEVVRAIDDARSSVRSDAEQSIPATIADVRRIVAEALAAQSEAIALAHARNFESLVKSHNEAMTHLRESTAKAFDRVHVPGNHAMELVFEAIGKAIRGKK